MKPITILWSEEKHNLFFSLVLKHLLLYVLLLIGGYFTYRYEVSLFQRVINSFINSEKIICASEIISKNNSWKYDEKERLFFNQTKVYSLQSCSASLIKE